MNNDYLKAMAQITQALREREAFKFEVVLLRIVLSECESRLENATDGPTNDAAEVIRNLGKARKVRDSILECLAASEIRMKEVI